MQRLPIEIITYIASSLGLHDIFNLGLTCRQFGYLVSNEDICRTALETHAPYSAEFRAARSTKQYARCLRRLVKTRDAIATATPYSAAFIAQANDFIYSNGMLCYTVGYETLRLLNLHKSADTELAIDTRALLRTAPEESLGNSKYKFRPIHYNDGILSCLYTPPKIEGRSRLIVVDLQQRKLLTAHRLDSSHKIFVRNNRNYLYYGTHSMTGDDGFKRWVLKRFNIHQEQWGAGHLDLDDLVGSDVGSTVCFEIIDDYFYGLSSLTSFEVYETDWTSYYYGFRFPVGSSQPRDMQLTSKDTMWRRQHEEGPIDDRWSTLNLEKDATTGNLMIVECRREWLVDHCSSTRTSYRTELKFSGLDRQSSDNSDSESEADENETSSGLGCSTTAPDPKQRPSEYVHRGDDGSTTPSITLTHCFIRSYNQSCETFIDLVNDPAAAESMTIRPQLRSISRLCPAGSSHPQKQKQYLADGSVQGADQPCGANTISWWPPQTDVTQHKAPLNALNNVLNPRGQNHCGNISGVMDDRSIVYAVGQRSSQNTRPLVFISFDPAIKLPGLDPWPGGPTAPFCARPKLIEDESTEQGPYPTPQSLPISASASRNASFSDGCIPDPTQPSTKPEPCLGKPEAPAWETEVTAMYLDGLCPPGTPIGFNFAHCEDDRGPSRKWW